MMKKTRLLATLVTLVAILILVSTCKFHPPEIDIGRIAAPDKQALIIERYSEDTVAGHEPEFIQIENRHKAVIAYTQIATHVSVYCPSIQSCWAFPYSGEIVEPMHLDYKNLDYSTIFSNNPPGWNHKKPYNFSKGPEWIKLLSPIIIISDNFIAFLALALLHFVPFLLASWFVPFTDKATSLVKILFSILGAILLTIYISLLLISTFLVFLLEFGLPSLYCIIIIGIADYSGLSLLKSFLEESEKTNINN